MSSEKPIILFAAMFLVLASAGICAAYVVARDDDISSRWKADLSEDVTAFASGKLNSESVLIVAANRTVYVFDKDGKQLFSSIIPSKGKVYALAVGDIDSDWKDEIVAGVGWSEADNINLDALYPPPEGLPEEEKLLYRILKSKGAAYVIKDGKATQLSGVDQWVRSIHLSDINGDKNNETVVVSGGFLTNYYKEYTTIINKVWVVGKTFLRNKLSSFTTNVTCHCSDCTWDARGVTKDCYECWWNNVSKVCYENHTIEDYQWNESKTKDWNLSESDSANASIVVYDKAGKLLSKTKMSALNAAFLNAPLVNLYHDNDEELVLGSKGSIYSFSSAGSVLSTYPFGGDIRYVYVSDVSGDGNDDIIFEQKNKSGAYTILAISREGKLLWKYSTNSTREAPITYMKNTGSNGEMMLSLSGSLYVLDSGGHLFWSYRIKYKGSMLNRITMMYSADLDADGLDDVVLASNNVVYVFEPVRGFIAVQRAKTYFALGNESYSLNRFAEAKTYLENAKRLYQEANDVEGIRATDLILSDVNSKLTGNRRTDAEAMYAKALTFYSVRDYSKAKNYAASAKAIYLEIGDSAGASSCDSLTKTIDEILARADTTLATSTSAYVVTTTVPAGPDLPALIKENLVIFLFLVAILAIGALMMRRKEAPKARKKPSGLEISEKKEAGGKKVEIKLKGEPKPEEGLKRDWNDLEAKWKKLEEL